MFKSKHVWAPLRCWYSSAIDLPGFSAQQTWDLVQPDARPGRITRREPPYIVESYDPGGQPSNGAVFDISQPPGGSRLAVHLWRDLPRQGDDDAWVMDNLQDFLDDIQRRAGVGVPTDRPATDLVSARAGPGVSAGPVDRQRVSDRILLPGFSAQQVWDLIRPAKAAMFASEVVDAYVLPGTGPGVGEVQVYETEIHGVRRTRAHRIVADEPPYLALTEACDEDFPSGLAYRIDQPPGGARLQVTSSADPPGASYLADNLARHREFTARFFSWIRASLAG